MWGGVTGHGVEEGNVFYPTSRCCLPMSGAILYRSQDLGERILYKGPALWRSSKRIPFLSILKKFCLDGGESHPRCIGRAVGNRLSSVLRVPNQSCCSLNDSCALETPPREWELHFRAREVPKPRCVGKLDGKSLEGET